MTHLIGLSGSLRTGLLPPDEIAAEKIVDNLRAGLKALQSVVDELASVHSEPVRARSGK